MTDAKKLNIKRSTSVFDGNLAHAVQKFSGERISVVFFSCRNYNKVGKSNLSFLKNRCGFQWPTDKSMSTLKKFCAAKPKPKKQ